jgi:hypothetical protein
MDSVKFKMIEKDLDSDTQEMLIINVWFFQNKSFKNSGLFSFGCASKIGMA